MTAVDLSLAIWRKSSRSSASGSNCVEVATLWHKSTRNGGSGDNSVEVAALWHKSNRSSGSGDNCVEVAPATSRVAVRDSKHPDDGALVLGQGSWRALLGDIKNGHCDLA